MSKIVVVQTSIDKESCGAFVEKIMQSGLSFCVHKQEIASQYFWDRKICNDEEMLLCFKTFKKDSKKLCKLIKKNHSYKIAEILVFKAHKVMKEYKRWGKESLRALREL